MKARITSTLSAIESAVLTLFAPLPECVLPDTVERLSLRGIKTTNVHWFLACSIGEQSLHVRRHTFFEMGTEKREEKRQIAFQNVSFINK